VAWALIMLSLIDVAAQIDSPVGRFLRRMTGLDNPSEQRLRDQANWLRVTIAMAWMAGYIAAIFIAGFLIATPIYIFLYMSAFGRKSLRTSALASAVITSAIWLVFEVLFKYPLYPGMIATS
jgi:hypothetical protein